MRTREWLCLAVVLMMAGCSGGSESKPPKLSGDPGANAGVASHDEKTDLSHDPAYLNQGWDYDTRMEWWYTSQGSRVLPYNWYLALEQTGSEELVNSKANMERLRFLSWPKDEKWNPDGLPIGFVKDVDTESGDSYFGFTCAACHTSKFKHNDKEVLVEGGPAHSDFDRFITEVGESMQLTATDTDKFKRFAERVLGAKAEETQVLDLKTKLTIEAAKLTERTKVNHPPHPNGYSRLDAFANIFNEGSAFAINELSNAKPANAPVSYPVVWDAPQHKVLQWNGAAVNAGLGPYTRNVGEVVGVFGGLRIEETGEAGSGKLKYKHHVNIAGLERVEEILTELWSPLWPNDVLPAIDKDKATRGEAHYKSLCINCHSVIADRTDLKREIGEKMVGANTVGTDPLAANNPLGSRSNTGLLEGHAMLPLTKFIPDLDVIEQFGEEADTAKIVGNGIIGILRDELGLIKLTRLLPAYVKAAKANKADQLEKGGACYKARPLNGIWASAPFLHNGSVPSLAELLKKPDQRVAKFYVGSWDIDPVSVGFAIDKADNTTEFDTSVPGNSNKGHDYGTDLSEENKSELIEYIKSL